MSEIKANLNKTAEERPILVRNTTDLQRLKLEKLMRNPTKPIIIPERPKERGMPSVPEFVRNVMGSSAGAGSGEFHVYRHLRRKEYARQKYMKEKGEKERLQDDYHTKLEENKKLAEEKTAKKRAKRMKKKSKMKGKNKKVKTEKSLSSDEKSEDESGTEDGKEHCEDGEQLSQNNCEQNVVKKESFAEENECAEKSLNAYGDGTGNDKVQEATNKNSVYTQHNDTISNSSV